MGQLFLLFEKSTTFWDNPRISGSGAFRFLEGFAVDTEDSVCCFSVDIEDY